MPPDERSRFLGNIRTETARLQDMIDRMLQLAAIENRNELRDVESIELGELARDAMESMQPVFAAKQLAVRVRADTPVRVDGERFLIRQALTNLVQNAADFSPPGGEIDISLAERSGSAEISVRDRGPGIPAYALDKVFDRFYSLSRPDTGKKSSGLGLSLVREVAHLHGGRVSIENHPDGGARATLSLPAHSEPERR
jgi:two-component system sensor histidine kinase CreC